MGCDYISFRRLQKTIADLGPTEKVAGLAYVVLARVKNLSDLMVEVTSFEMLQSIKKSINFAFRVIEEKRIHKFDKLPQESLVFHFHF